MSREHRLVVENIDELTGALAAEQAATAVIDIEPVIAPWGCRDQTYAEGVVSLLGRIRAQAPTVRQVYLVSNSPMVRPALSNLDPPTTVTFRARKPWRVRGLSAATRPIVVVGDQPLTDGLLAWRLGSTFLHWQHRGRAPWWPRWQQAIGRVVTAFLFVTRPRTELRHERGNGSTRQR